AKKKKQAEADRTRKRDERRQEQQRLEKQKQRELAEKKRLREEVRELKEKERQRELAEKKRLREEARELKEKERQRELTEKKRLREEARELKEKERQRELTEKKRLREEARELKEKERQRALEESAREAERVRQQRLEKLRETQKALDTLDQANKVSEEKFQEESDKRNSDTLAAQALVKDKLDKYINAIVEEVYGAWSWGGTKDGSRVYYELVLSDSGEVVGIKLIQSSGNSAYDQSVEKAIRKASPLMEEDLPDALFFQRTFGLGVNIKFEF
ncbi:cell envelope integrity protein TolA, partial [Burkholderiales bacterium]|nr:cell envelope integrity protein TolA [Burkholderiales bacterium]